MKGLELLVGIAAGAGTAVVGFYLRTRSAKQQGGRGGDAWYYLLYVEELRRSRRRPVSLPYFLLDIQEQWYPPGFPMLLAVLPPTVLKRYLWAIGPAIDCVQLGILYLFTLLATGSLAAAVVAGAVYAITPTLITESENLNSRSLGSLLFTLTMLSRWAADHRGWSLAHVLVAGFGGAVLLTHKLSFQALIVVLLGEAILTWRMGPLMALVGSAGTALVVSRGSFLKVLKGHKDILRYWARNLQYLGAHQVYDSPLFAAQRPSRVSPRFHVPGLGGLLRHAKILLAHSPYVLALPLAFFEAEPAGFLQGGPLRWVLLIYLWTCATTFLPPLRFLGEGVKYLKLAAFPLALLLGSWAQGRRGLLLVPLLIVSLYVLLRATPHPEWSRVGDRLLRVAEYLRGADPGGIMVLPPHAADAVAYLTRRQVMWGAHSSGYDKLEPFFPVLRRPVEAFFEEYDLRFLLLDRTYVTPEDLRLESFQMVLAEEPYQLYRYAAKGVPRSEAPEPAPAGRPATVEKDRVED